MTNGQDLLVRGLLKPISTLRRPLESVDLVTREPALAAYERSRCLRGAGGRRDRRSHGGDRAGAGVPRKIRRRFARAKRAAISTAIIEQVKNLLMMVYPIVKILAIRCSNARPST